MYIKNNVLKYEKKKVYYKKRIIKNKKDNYYEKSINALTKYIRENERNPNEKQWNEYAIKEKYLSSKTIGYLSEVGFNTLCRNIRKQTNKEK